MLDRLLSIHERLVVQTNSSVGIGNRDSQKTIIKSGNPNNDAELWQKLKPEIQAIMRMPATLQQKQYQRLPQHKLRRFDSRVLQSYTHSGGQWAEGVVYEDDHNSHENRVIKCIMRKIATQLFPSQKKDLYIPAQIDDSIRNELLSQFNEKAVHWYDCAVKPCIQNSYPTNTNANKISFNIGTYQEKSYQTQYQSGSSRKLRIFFRICDGGFEIRTFPFKLQQRYYDPFKMIDDIPGFSLYPFTKDNNPCGLWLQTKDLSVAYQIIDSLAKVYTDIENGDLKQQSIIIDYRGGNVSKIKNDKLPFKYRGGDRSVEIISLTDVSACTTSSNGSDDHIRICSLYDFFSHIVSSSALVFMETTREIELVEFVESRRNYYHHLNSQREADNQSYSARQEIKTMLSNQWFELISDNGTSKIQPTPLFLYNRHYRAVYNTLHEIIQNHPMLASDFIDNLYGVHETALIYEYWVFYELLNRFLNLGFTINGNKDLVRNSVRNLFVNHLLGHSMPEQFTVCLQKHISTLDDSGNQSGNISTFEIMIGFNCVFGTQEAPARRQYDKYLTPDYFIRVTRDGGYHWYFLDAKYEEYTEAMLYDRAQKGKRKNSIGDVCYDKYINLITERHFINDFADYHCSIHPECWKREIIHNHTVEGAYLIVAKYHSEFDEQITTKDRLCGADSHGITNEKPLHKYGSIVFRPETENELTSLIQLIFEYKEGGERIQTGEAERKQINSKNGKKWIHDVFYNKRSQTTYIHAEKNITKKPITLHTCWDSSSDHTMIDGLSVTTSPQLTKTGKYKYYTLCSCGARRYENYCICKTCRHEIIKHDTGNYHHRKRSTNSWDKWNYVCPYCGSDIDSSEAEESDSFESTPNFV